LWRSRWWWLNWLRLNWHCKLVEIGDGREGHGCLIGLEALEAFSARAGGR